MTMFEEAPKTITAMTEKELRQEIWRLKGILDKREEKIIELNATLLQRAEPKKVAEVEHYRNLFFNLKKVYSKAITMFEAVVGEGGQYTHNEIIDMVCKFYGVKFEDVRGKRRWANLVLPRQVCFYILSQRGVTLDFIGKLLGNRDHTTVLYGKQKIRDTMHLMSEKEIDFINSLTHL